MTKDQLIPGVIYRNMSWPKVPFMCTEHGLVNMKNGDTIKIEEARHPDWEQIILKMIIVVETEI